MLQKNNFIFFCLCFLFSCNSFYSNEKENKTFFEANQNLEKSCVILEGKLKNVMKEIDRVTLLHGNSGTDNFLTNESILAYNTLNEIIKEIKLIKKELKSTQKISFQVFQGNKRGEKLLAKIHHYLANSTKIRDYFGKHYDYYKNNLILASLVDEKENYIQNQFGEASIQESIALLTSIEFTLLDIFTFNIDLFRETQDDEVMINTYKPILLMPQIIKKGDVIKPVFFFGYENSRFYKGLVRKYASNIGEIVSDTIIINPQKEGLLPINISDTSGRGAGNPIQHLFYVLPNDKK